MNVVEINKGGYRYGGRSVLLHSGEFHYFRVPRKDWTDRMRRFREAGGNCLATYVPWLVHEPHEGRFEFDRGDGITDLAAFLQMAAAEELTVLVRPGPYQYSELQWSGLAPWLLDRYPQCRALDRNGQPISHQAASYLHPVFLDKVRAWFDAVAPRLACHLASTGGPIAFVQLDNEAGGIHVWSGSQDFHPETMEFGREDGRFARFLLHRYGSWSAVADRYRARIASGCDLVADILPREGEPGTLFNKDWFDFTCRGIAEYFGKLAELLAERGVVAPLVHNAACPEMNAWFIESNRKFAGRLLIGSDHYYNLNQKWAQNHPTPQYAARCFVSLEMLRLMGHPPTVFELPAGSLSDWPPITALDLESCWRTNLALGMKGLNYYILTGGCNPPGCGTTGDIYDYQAPIAADGSERPSMAAIRRTGSFMKRYAWLGEASGESSLRIGLDWLVVRGPQHGHRDLSRAWDLMLRGLTTTAFCAHWAPSYCELESDDWLADLDRPVLLPGCIAMTEQAQRQAVRFLRLGGKLLLADEVPSLNEHFQPCTLLADELGLVGSSRPRLASAPFSIGLGDLEHITVNERLWVVDCIPNESQALGRTLDGDTAWAVALAGGRAIWIGLCWMHSQHSHAAMLSRLAISLGAKRRVFCDKPELWVSMRTAGTRTLVFALNLATSPIEAELAVHPVWAQAPISLGRCKLRAMEVKAIPLHAGKADMGGGQPVSLYSDGVSQEPRCFPNFKRRV